MDVPAAAQSPEDTPTSRRKPRACAYCKRLFRRHEHLQRHLRIREFSTHKIELDSENLLHIDTNEKPYKCSCGASFGRRDLLKRHQGSGHPPITPSTHNPSPTGIQDSSNVQSQTGYTQPAIQPFSPGLADLQPFSSGATSQSGQFSHVQLEGTL